MQQRKECIAMLLAGGQGSRLGVLTNSLAKPAVPFGGKYRIIDFPLSNCINSGIDTVGVLTQYQPLVLNAYIGNGQPWDLDRISGGVHILPPFIRGKAGEWYTGTANAIYQNIHFIEEYDPDYVLVLSGDHVYKMDYSRMLAQHKRSGADCTIAVIEVPLSEASRFGIMNTDDQGAITSFEEKPKQPKSNLASMGIYIFSWPRLREYLVQDERNKASSNDFGKDVIPSMLRSGQRLFAYRFEGYWKDVGTVESLWQANMDLLEPNLLNLHERAWRVYARNPVKPPHYVAPQATVRNSLLTEGAQVYGEVRNSVVFHGAMVEPGATVLHSIVMPDAIIESGAQVSYSIIGEQSTVGAGAQVGEQPRAGEQPAIALVGGGLCVRRNAVVPAGQMVGRDAEPANT